MLVTVNIPYVSGGRFSFIPLFYCNAGTDRSFAGMMPEIGDGPV